MQIHEVTAGQIKAGAKKIGTGAWNAAKNAGSAVGSAVGDELERLAFGSTVTDYDQLGSTPVTSANKAKPAKTPNYAQNSQGKYGTVTTNAPTQTVPNMSSFPNIPVQTKSAANTQVRAVAPDPEVLDPLTKPAQRYTGINNNNVIDVDARVVPDPAKAAPAAKLPAPAAKLPAPAAAPVPNYAQNRQFKYGTTTTNAPTTVPKVNPAAAPVPYMFDGRKLDPKNVNDAQKIAAMQAQGVTSSTTAQIKQQGKQQ
jgi:hypothetical protein